MANPKTKTPDPPTCSDVPGAVHPCCGDGTQVPEIESITLEDLGRGGYEWQIWWKLPKPACRDGWIIQEIDKSGLLQYSNNEQAQVKVVFWEAFKVSMPEGWSSNDRRKADFPPRQVTLTRQTRPSAQDDTYRGAPWLSQGASDSTSTVTSGRIVIRGQALFYPVELPKCFTPFNKDTEAFAAPSTNLPPEQWDGKHFWEYRGIAHNLVVSWNLGASPPVSNLVGQAGATYYGPGNKVVSAPSPDPFYPPSFGR